MVLKAAEWLNLIYQQWKRIPHIHISTADKSPAVDPVYEYTQRWFKFNLNYSKKWMTKGNKQNKINSSTNFRNIMWWDSGRRVWHIEVCPCVCFRAAEACGGGHGPDQPGHETGREKPDRSVQVLRPLRLPLWQVQATPAAAQRSKSLITALLSTVLHSLYLLSLSIRPICGCSESKKMSMNCGWYLQYSKAA